MSNRPASAGSDLWWLDPRDDAQDQFLCVGHHLPISDDDDPRATQWFHGVEGGRFSENTVRYPASFLQTWKDQCGNSNVYRSLRVFSSLDNVREELGPFLIDIDNSDWDDRTDAYKEDLRDALDVARRAARVLIRQWTVKSDDLRVFFTGRKGFNLEVRPSALEIKGSYNQQLQKSMELLNRISDQLRAEGTFDGRAVSRQGTVIDMIYGSLPRRVKLRHPYIRLHGSFNRWISGGREISRRKVEIKLDDLFSQEIEMIIGKSIV